MKGREGKGREERGETVEKVARQLERAPADNETTTQKGVGHFQAVEFRHKCHDRPS